MRHQTPKTVIISGGASGIGKALAFEFLKLGATVVLIDIDEAALQKTLREACEISTQCLTFCGDIGNVKDVAEFHNFVMQNCDGINILINNAGISMARTPFLKISKSHWEKIMNVNFWGALNLTEAFLPSLLSQKEAFIINISSILSLISSKDRLPYSVTKSALRTFSDCLREDLKETSVKVFTILPGSVVSNIVINGLAWEDKKLQVKLDGIQKRYGLSPETAAKKIIQSLKKGKRRVLVGPDAYLLNLLHRLFPVAHTRITDYFLSRV